MKNLTIQNDLRPELPHIYRNIDYHQFRETLIKIDEILTKGKLEENLIEGAMGKYMSEEMESQQELINDKNYVQHWKHLQYALRCNIARHLTGESFRKFSTRLTDSALFQWFTGIHYFTSRKSVSKSTMERFDKLFDETMIAEKLHLWQAGFLTDEQKAGSIGLNEAMDCSKVFIDSTCVKANIHFPVDWVLLRDGTRSLLSAIKTIRAQGLKHRMIDPAVFMSKMNKFCMSMIQTRRKKDSKKQRKKILREMKNLSNCIRKHAERYRTLLINRRGETSWSEAQAEQVINRIDNILEQLPAAINQAHERIIGERQIASSEKILSLYEPDVNVIVRGKSGSEVEFGQGLLLTEQKDGLIVDWKLFKEQPKADSVLLKEAVTRIQTYYGRIKSIAGDRGFHSKANDEFLQQNETYNAICPKNITLLQERITDHKFLELLKRRSQTEGRIGIFKNVFLGKPIKSKGFLHKQVKVSWCVITHNLWVIARKALADEKSNLEKAA